MRILPRPRLAFLLLSSALLAALPAQERSEHANWQAADKFAPANLRKFVYSTSVTPAWLGKSERFWYWYRTSVGTQFWLVDAEQRSKRPLFDHVALATALSVATKKPQDAAQLELGGAKVDDAGSKLSFTCDGRRFEYELMTGTLADKGAAPRAPAAPATPGNEGGERDDQRRRDGRQEQQDQQQEQQQQEQQQEQQDQRQDRQQQQQQQNGTQAERTGRSTGEGARPTARSERDVRLLSPDGRAYVVVREHDLYVVEGNEVPPEPAAQPAVAVAVPAGKDDAAAKAGDAKAAVAVADDGKAGEVESSGAKASEAKASEAKASETKGNEAKGTDAKSDASDARSSVSTGATDANAAKTANEAVAGATEAPANATTKPATAPAKKPTVRFDEATGVRLTSDGAERYSFTGGGGPGGAGRNAQRTGNETAPAAVPPRSRANATWAKDSQAFFATRRDSRKVQELFLVDSLGQPRPTLQTYPYTMPGEATVAQSELWVFDRATKALRSVGRKWTQESYQDVHFLADGHELRFVRRDRLQRNAELCAFDPATGSERVLLREAIEDGTLALQNVRYLGKRNQLVWWSERSGWGHFYLHDATTGAEVLALTSGSFRARSIVEVDEDAGVLWFRASGRERGENLYHEHLYRVGFDGKDLRCLDPGDATHRSTLSPSRRFLVDTFSRVDLAPHAVLRSGNDGSVLLELETTDLTKLAEMGWRMPERFTVKAADGVTDLYGNLWKPFDFDAAKHYPIIVNVYPGPQQEGVTHTFSATAGPQHLAQLGFVVVQVGHRGGTPDRDKAYGTFGFGNLRDYGLEDKKAAIEQLADRLAFLDITRVGIYGHSGGGFMTAAALLKPPYNRFFKVGVASAGNHDNNIYNANWSERWHGLTEREDAAAKKQAEDAKVAGKAAGDKAEADVLQGAQGAAKEPPKPPFEIKVPTNAELAANLEGKLLLVHGEIDNNVHPANTMRLVDALIKANKRFDMLLIPGARHSFGAASEYFRQRLFEYFAEHLLGDRQQGADITRKRS